MDIYCTPATKSLLMVPDEAINILMVEDNTGDQYLLSELLNISGLTINTLFSAIRLDQALSQLSQHIDIILLDLSLPDSSGISTFNSIIKHAGKTPVVILSGLTDTKLALDAITLGAQDYLIKVILMKSCWQKPSGTVLSVKKTWKRCRKVKSATTW